MWECEWWRLYKTCTSVKKHKMKNFLTGFHLESIFFWGKRSGKLFVYVQCNTDFPDKMILHCAKFLFGKNTVVDGKDISKLMEQFAEKEGLLSQPERIPISSFKLQNRAPIARLLLFYLELELVCTKISRSVEYTPKK